MPSDPQHWEQVYSSKAAEEVSWFQSDPATSLRLLRAQGIAPAS